MSKQSSPLDAFDVELTLSKLKDFQRSTVEYVFGRMYGKEGVNRFLVADEVGLGKTMVAKGIVAKIVDVLRQKKGRRIDIVYLCANRDIARQNIDRLNLFASERVSQANRLTLLPLHLKQLEPGPNFIAFTPATALELGRATGVARERAFLYRLLSDVWNFDGAAPKNFFQVGKANDNWDRAVSQLLDEIEELGGIDAGVRSRFGEELKKLPGLRSEFKAALKHFQRRRDRPRNLPQAIRSLRDPLIGKFRECLARACLSALKPDLIILDEFQKFRSLLKSDQSEEGEELSDLGKQFLNYPDAKILLLSATPYKAYTLAHEGKTDDHHKDFLEVAKFLLDDAIRLGDLKACLKEFNEALFDTTAQGAARLLAAKRKMELALRRHIVRTERLGVTADRDGMIEEVPMPACRLKAQDLEAFKALDALALSMDQPDIVEYWKSAPYVLNFMERDGYVLKRHLVERIDNDTAAVSADRVAGLRHATLRSSALAKFDPFDLQNSRLRALVSTILDKGAWKLLWIPPSLPYYASTGTPYDEVSSAAITKVLIFSNWRFVPRAVAGLVSYETERRIAELANERLHYQDLSTRKRRPLLTFSLDERGEARDLNHLVPLYPSPSLCALLDPLEEAKLASAEGRTLDHESLLKIASERVIGLLQAEIHKNTGSEEREDQRWYSSAMLKADLRKRRNATRAWFKKSEWSGFVKAKGDDEDSGFKNHIDKFFSLAGSAELGKMPEDLSLVLAKVAIGSPAVVALRSFQRLARSQGVSGFPSWMLDAAARVGVAFRSLFSQPDATVLTRALYGGGVSRADERYWEAMLDHCVAGNLQAVMDEHVHVLRESLGVVSKPPEESIKRIAEEIASAMTLQAIVLRVDDFKIGEELRLADRQISFRCRSALRFDTGTGEDGEGETRADQVRVAFNSPFRPFILASTAVGQEGLDFHLWCHSIFHWNLPSNPVDFEQREGRVHRYKGHVVRRSVASALTIAALRDTAVGSDPWESLFCIARKHRKEGQNDLVPYWVFNGSGEFKIRRYIPALPLSRESTAAGKLRAALGAYRLVFGQPRQEDLLAFLQSAYDVEDLNAELYAIDLSPPS
jgi:hypothetical protein